MVRKGHREEATWVYFAHLLTDWLIQSFIHLRNLELLLYTKTGVKNTDMSYLFVDSTFNGYFYNY